MKRLALAAAVAAVLALPSAHAATAPKPVLGLDGRDSAGRLAWYNPATLARVPGRTLSVGRHTGAWALSPNGSMLAIADFEYPSIRFVSLGRMRSPGAVLLPWSGDGWVTGITWPRPDRVLVAVSEREGGFVAVLDPQKRKELRRVKLPVIRNTAAVDGGVALLVGPPDVFAPATVAVVDADGAVRTTVVDRISVGSIEHAGDPRTFSSDVREPGFALDRAGGRAFVVSPDFTVAEVNLATLGIAYHSPSTRTLAKNITGPSRQAAWLGNGLLAVAGVDYKGTHDGEPVGLRLVDTRTWTTRLVDSAVPWFGVGDGVLVAEDKVYGFDGSLRYRVALGSGQWLSVQGKYGYVCGSARGSPLRRVLQLDSGATLKRVTSVSAPSCPRLLYGRAST
jgi:hypothetical protein